MKMQKGLVFLAGITLFLLQNADRAVTQSPHAVSTESTSKTSGVKPVIRVQGRCNENKAGTTPACATVVTREQFEDLIKALNRGGQPLPANARKQLAKTYAESLAVEAAARQAGLEDTPEFREFMKWTVARSMTDFYRRTLQEKYQTPSSEEIDAYYQQHIADYERANLVRILIPRQNASGSDANDFDKKARETADEARASLLNGQDPLQIQKDAYSTLGLAGPPHTDLGNRRRTDLLADEAADIFSMQPGQVTPVEVEPANYVIYKVTGRDSLSKEQVKTDISRVIFQQKFKDAMKAIVDAAPAEVDEQYLGPEATARDARRERTSAHY